MWVEVGFVDEVCTMETGGLRVVISTKLNLNDPYSINRYGLSYLLQ